MVDGALDIIIKRHSHLCSPSAHRAEYCLGDSGLMQRGLEISRQKLAIY